MNLQSDMGGSVENASSLTLLRILIEQHGQEMVAIFYETMMQDEVAEQFLNHSVVHNRLSGSMYEWLVALLGEADIQDCPDLQERQRVVGRVHARIKIPIHTVIAGAMQLKREITRRLLEREEVGRAVLEAVQIANERIDRAIMIMSQTYVKDTADSARLDEAYRLFSLDQDVSVEKESQRSNLMNWSQKTLFSLLRGHEKDGLLRLSASEFGFWLRHRAEFMFQHSMPLKSLQKELERVDSGLLPKLEQALDAEIKLKLLGEFQEAVDSISYLIGELFEALNAMETGRDALTRALNRRFLPSILGREVSYANQNGSPLAILLLDVDHFKSVNDTYGHQAGDTVLRQVAQVIMEVVRPSDFVFRYGGEEFLIVLAETPVQDAERIADRIRHAVGQRQLEVGGEAQLRISVSVGVAGHTGHPDQSYIIKSADGALYQAKAAGRNTVVVAE